MRNLHLNFMRGEQNLKNMVQINSVLTVVKLVEVQEWLGFILKIVRKNRKKDGKNKKDLLKAIHYIILMMYTLEEENRNAPTS